MDLIIKRLHMFRTKVTFYEGWETAIKGLPHSKDIAILTTRDS